MGKGDNRRPCQIPRSEEEQRWRDIFGEKPLKTVMSEEERAEFIRERDQLAGGDRPDSGQVPIGEGLPSSSQTSGTLPKEGPS